MSRYWTELVRRLQPYVPGEQPQDRQYIKLNTNESPYPPSPRVEAAVDDLDKARLRLYPDPESVRLRQAIADAYGVGAAQVFVGNGSDEVLAHSFQAFFQQPRPLLFPDISYSFYPVFCDLYQIEAQTVALRDDYTIAVDDYAVPHGGIVVPNPNAPTGRLLPLDQVAALCESSEAVVLIDEAYVDFGGDSAISLIDQFDNLLVVQTFSKSRSLAGLRLGFAVGHSDLIEALNRVKNSFNSYPVDSVAQAAAIASLADVAYFDECRRRIIATRERLTAALEGMGFEVLPSAANFVFARHATQRAAGLYSALKEKGVLVRFFDKPRIDNHLRITVGTDDEIDALLDRLAAILGSAEASAGR